MTHLKRNINLFLWQRFLHEFLLIAPILIPFYQYNRLGAFAFYLSQSAYALTVFIMEVPSGYLADVVGRRNTLRLGAFLYPFGFLFYAAGSSLALFLCAEIIMAVANSMRSGCDSALLYDSLSVLSRQDEYAAVEGKGHQFARTGTGIASIAGGLLASIALRLPFWSNFILALAAIPLALAFTEPTREKAQAERPLHNIILIAKNSLHDSSLRPFILYVGLIGSVSIISLWAYFLYYQALSIPLAYFGLLFAAFQFSAALAARFSASLVSSFGPDRILQLSVLIAPILLLIGLIRSPFMLIAIMIHPFLWNMTLPVLLEQINIKTVPQIRATVLSLANMGVSFGYVLIGPVFGQLSDRLPLQLCFTILAVLFLLGALILVYQIKQHWSEPACHGQRP